MKYTSLAMACVIAFLAGCCTKPAPAPAAPDGKACNMPAKCCHAKKTM